MPSIVTMSVIESPEQREQPVERAAYSSGLADVAPRFGDIERGFDLVGATVRDLVVLALIPCTDALSLGEIQRDAGGGAVDLVREIAVVAL